MGPHNPALEEVLKAQWGEANPEPFGKTPRVEKAKGHTRNSEKKWAKSYPGGKSYKRIRENIIGDQSSPGIKVLKREIRTLFLPRPKFLSNKLTGIPPAFTPVKPCIDNINYCLKCNSN